MHAVLMLPHVVTPSRCFEGEVTSFLVVYNNVLKVVKVCVRFTGRHVYGTVECQSGNALRGGSMLRARSLYCLWALAQRNVIHPRFGFGSYAQRTGARDLGRGTSTLGFSWSAPNTPPPLFLYVYLPNSASESGLLGHKSTRCEPRTRRVSIGELLVDMYVYVVFLLGSRVLYTLRP